MTKTKPIKLYKLTDVFPRGNEKGETGTKLYLSVELDLFLGILEIWGGNIFLLMLTSFYITKK